jgi:eukaryotic-like serine/threonine-protein kinase
VQHGFVWCPHCSNPHPLDASLCPVTKLALGRSLHERRGSSLSPPRSLIGTTIAGRYRVLRLIGRGGMGLVFEAENLLLRRQVAIKVIAGVRSDEALHRLKREAQLVAASQHPNICDIYDVGALPDGSPYLVLERLRGETLGSCLRRETHLSTGAVVDIFSQLLSGLDAAHRAQIVHRDLKPENVFLSRRVGCRPLVKLMDFGFAKGQGRGDQTALTRPGRALGTPRYMAPEQLLGVGVDARTDLFAVAVMLYESLTGVHPFLAGSLQELQAKILYEPPPPLGFLRPDLSRELEDVLLHALAKRPAARLSSAIAFQRAIVRTLGVPNSQDDLDETGPLSQTVPMRVRDPSSQATPI